MDRSIAVVGLGYVGLPLAVAFGKKAPVIGFDISRRRIEELQRREDHTHEVSPADLAESHVEYTTDPAALKRADFIIVTVPTPVDDARQPDLSCLVSASELVGPQLRPGAIVVFESTVYPGVTEDVCVPALERASGRVCGRDFKVGYSPERINPGDKEHTLARVVKVVAGMDAETLEIVAEVYGLVAVRGVFKAASIKTAEAAKVIENTQRDLNIALMNELAMIFHRMGLDTSQVLEAAATKWNFLPFKPGLVGGHCISVDPYYLTQKAERLGYHPQVILAGRRINDGMGKYVAEQTIKLLVNQEISVRQARVAVLGITFKENVPDIRNSKVVDIVRELSEYGITCVIHDPLASAEETQHEYGLALSPESAIGGSDAVILAVPHKAFLEKGAAWIRSLLRRPSRSVVMDVKSVLRKEDLPETAYWRL
ncbi:MAG: nucleotide sugar dehydrogenase [Candidatus Brocadiia bacterium]